MAVEVAEVPVAAAETSTTVEVAAAWVVT